MNKKIKAAILFIAGLCIIVLSLSSGTTFISPMKFFDHLSGAEESNIIQIVLSLRLPRLLMALTVGAALSVSGVIFQAILKNPLSDPFTIGVSSGASLGACFSIIFSLGSLYVAMGSFIGSMAVALSIYLVSKKRRFGSGSLILAGISLSFILSSAVLLIFAISPAQQVHKALLWLMGDLSIARYTMLWQGIPLVIGAILLSLVYHRHLNIIAFGDELASTMGISDRDVKNLFWIASILAAVSVSMAGIIGFVGLTVPHMVRSQFGPDHKRLIIISAIAGAFFLGACDLIGRVIASPFEVPIGVITGFFGGIFFLVLMIGRGERV